MQITKIKGLHDVDVNNVPQNEIRYIDIYFSGRCNFNCLYCFTNHQEGRLTTNDRKKIIDQANKLGAVSLVATGAGEPILDSGFKKIIEHACQLGMTSIIYTNGYYIDFNMARFLYQHNVSPLVKIESLNPEIHDQITQVAGSQAKALTAIENLLRAGYGVVHDGITRIGIAAVYTALNIHGLADLKKFCQQYGILLTVDELGLEKQAKKNSDKLFVEKKEIDIVKQRLCLTESGINFYSSQEVCNFANYGIRVDQDGNISYCTMQDLSNIIGNVLDCGVEKAVWASRIAKNIAMREKIKTIEQVNQAMKRCGLRYNISFPINTCPFKAGDNLAVKKL